MRWSCPSLPKLLEVADDSELTAAVNLMTCRSIRSAKLVIVTSKAEVIADAIFWLQSKICWTMRLLVDEELFIELLADSLWGGLLMMGKIIVGESRLLKTRITLSGCFWRRISETSAKNV